jgi:hypothetical protein
MKALVKWMFRFAIGCAVLLLALVLLRNVILRSSIEGSIRAGTGMETRIGYFNASLFETVVRMEDLRLYNAAAFGGGPFLDIGEVYVIYDLSSLFSRKLHLKFVRLHMRDLNVVMNKDGQINAALPSKASVADNPRIPKSAFEFAGIDTLRLTMDRVTFHDLRKDKLPLVIDVQIKDVDYKEVRTVNNLEEILLKSLEKPAIQLLNEILKK